MNEDERALMISMAQALKTQGEEILALQEKGSGATPISIHPIPSPLYAPPTSSVEHEHGNKSCKMNVQFDGHLGLTEKQRMDESIRFLRELEELFQAYNVIHLNGTYDRVPTGTI